MISLFLSLSPIPHPIPQPNLQKASRSGCLSPSLFSAPALPPSLSPGCCSTSQLLLLASLRGKQSGLLNAEVHYIMPLLPNLPPHLQQHFSFSHGLHSPFVVWSLPIFLFISTAPSLIHSISDILIGFFFSPNMQDFSCVGPALAHCPAWSWPESSG